MKLADFMELKGLDDGAVADLVRSEAVECDRSTVSRHRRGIRRPEWAMIARYKEISGGLITAEDWLVLAEAAE